MKKTSILITIISVAVWMLSCHSVKEVVSLSAVGGEWKIAEVNGEVIPSEIRTSPFIAFDIQEQTIHGNAGCNVFNGSFTTDAGQSGSISFPNIITTMMACPDGEVERKILLALNEVHSFDVLRDGSIGLYDAAGTQIIVLKK